MINKIKWWARRKLSIFLGIDKMQQEIDSLNDLYSNLVNIGVDVHFKEPHMILVYSKLKGGQIRHIPADFKDLHELNRFVRWLKDKYRTKRVTWDMHPVQRRFFDE